MALAQHPFLDSAPAICGRAACSRSFRWRFLEPADVDRYLALEFPEHRFPPDFSALIHAKTEGSPLFMADLVRYLRDSGRHRRRQGHLGARSLDVRAAEAICPSRCAA